MAVPGDVEHEELPLLGVGDVGHVVVEGDAAGRGAVGGQVDRADVVAGGAEHLQLLVRHAYHHRVAWERATKSSL